MEEEIAALEFRIEQLEKSLSDETDLSDYESKIEKINSLQSKLDAYYEKWLIENE